MIRRKPELLPDDIEHILAAIRQIEKYCSGLQGENFTEHDMAHDAGISQLEIIGEAARRIIAADPELVKQHPGLELQAASRRRNALAHGYETVNLRAVWDTVGQKRPALKSEATSVLAKYTLP